MALAGCKGRDGSPGSVAAKLRTCGLLSEGEVGSLPFYAPTSCYRRCLAGGDCAELEAALCDRSVDLLVRCDRRCAFECGNGALIEVEQVCDGVVQCEDGSDEQGCPTFECEGGETIPAEQQCDGRWHCSSGADEQGCPTFTCDGGAIVPASAKCDGEEDCPEGSDEADCPGFACDGRTLPPAMRCDGTPQCNDKSDEAGCAEITAMCLEDE